MRSLNRVIRFLIWGMIASWIIAIMRRMLLPVPAGRAGTRWNAVPTPAAPKPLPLYRDSWCGTFVSPEISVRWEQGGQVEHFCSRECLNRYAASQRGAASA